MNLSRVLDITQEIKELLKAILVLDYYDFTIPLAILAGKRDFLHFDQWMTDRIKSVGEPFVISLITYLEDCIMKKGKDQSAPDPPDKRLEKSYLSPEKLAVIFDNLRKCKNLPEGLIQQIENIHKEAINLFPSLVTPSNESPEIEDEANRWFQKVFVGEISVSDLINLMKTYKESKDPKQNEIYACMIHNLLDEYKFFGKYPDKELKITGQLFGSIIQNKLVDCLLEKISLKYAFEALKRSGKMLRFGAYALEQFLDRLKEWPNSIELILRMTNFKNAYPDLYKKVQEIGQQVVKPIQQGIDQPRTSPPIETSIPPPSFNPPTTQSSLLPKPQPTYPVQQSPPPTYPRSAYNVYQQPTLANVNYPWRREAPMQPFQRTSPGLPKYDYPITPEMSARPPGYHSFLQNVENRGYANEFHGHPQNSPMPYLPTLMEGIAQGKANEEVAKPNKQIVEKLTLSLNMMTEIEYLKVKDTALKCIEADANTLTWLAHTIVDRAVTQNNNHVLFFKFISAMQNRSLANTVLTETAGRIKKMLELNKGNENPDEKAKKVIRNLAAFIGIITIGDNKPILAKDLDLKEILLEGYNSGGITLPLILVCQILRQAQNSKVFKPNNPWMRAIFSILVDLSQTPTISGNSRLSSEITLLYTNLGIAQDYYPPAKIISPKPTPPPQLIKVTLFE
jgi:CCR4-NOT transcription complex subunit 1